LFILSSPCAQKLGELRFEIIDFSENNITEHEKRVNILEAPTIKRGEIK